ncbi:unnamed protein product [Staurois parvus]|uniref:Uncharacterized protein n=1 Tax=Staurois parvus TaxID=386267 RepID=A0ABN9HJN7_9NEOB|nr:unnamed protein product [Staurois parvus]
MDLLTVARMNGWLTSARPSYKWRPRTVSVWIGVVAPWPSTLRPQIISVL